MRSKLALAGVALLAAISLGGCCSLYDAYCGPGSGRGTASPPWMRPGLVRVVRNETQVIGYVSTDPISDDVQHWLLRAGEALPLDVQDGDRITFHYEDGTRLDGYDLCQAKGQFLLDPTLWIVDQHSGLVGTCPE